MSILGFVIYPTGEPYTKEIFKRMCEEYVVTDVIRCRTSNPAVFRQKMTYMYQNIAPSKMAKANAKIAAQGDSSSFLLAIVKGYKGDNGDFKKGIRKYSGLNCIHSADNPDSVMDHIKWLLGEDMIDKINFEDKKEIDIDKLFDFMYWDFKTCGKILRNEKYDSIFTAFMNLTLNDIAYAVVNFGVTVNENVYTHNKDIEIVCSDRTRAIDILGATFLHKTSMKNPHEGSYLIRTVDRKIKLDFSLSVMIPIEWRNKILATRVLGNEGLYTPQDRDTYWLTMFERTVYKPRKRKPSMQHRYADGAKWNDLVTWGINMGIHDQIRKHTPLEDCQKAVKRYMKEL
jgi:hypothetical protein